LTDNIVVNLVGRTINAYSVHIKVIVHKCIFNINVEMS